MTSLPIDQLIDTQRGLISREIFVSPEFHKEELERLFSRAWLFVGHESQIPKPGDYFVSRMGEESVIMCRDAQRQGACVLEFLPPPGDESLPLRTGQYVIVRLPIP